MENYSDIVAYFKNLNTLSGDDLVLLVDTIDNMSEEIFEHYKALCDRCRDELKKLLRVYREQRGFEFLEDADRCRLAYVVTKACSMDILLTEKYEEMVSALTAQRFDRR